MERFAVHTLDCHVLLARCWVEGPLASCADSAEERFRGAYDRDSMRRESVGRTVPTIVPAARQNRACGANTSQLARSGKLKKVKDLRGKLRLDERQISV